MKRHLIVLLIGIMIVFLLGMSFVPWSRNTEAMPFSGPDITSNLYLPIIAKQYPLITRLSWWPYGTCYFVAYDQSSGFIVAGSGGMLMILDVSDPSHPRKVSELVLEGQHQLMSVSDKIVYVTTFRRNGLQIIDISNPLRPMTIGFYPADWPHDIEVVGKIAYLSAGSSLDILDVSNPQSPKLIARKLVAGRAAFTSLNQNNHKLYLLVWDEGVYVLDISNPAAPNQLGFYSSPNMTRFYVFGNFAIVGDWHSNNLKILDVSNDFAFEVISTIELNEPADSMMNLGDVKFSGSLAYVSGEYWWFLRIIDISDPYNPVIVGAINQQEATIQLNEAGIPLGQYYVGIGALALVDNLLYNASWTNGIGVFDVSNPASIRAIGNLDTPDPYFDVSVSGHIACIANLSDGLRLLDISDPLHITEIGSQSPGMAAGTYSQVICRDAQYAYVATEGHGLQILDIAQPDSPHLVGALDTPGFARGIALSNDLAYIADREGGVRIIDVRVPSSPVEVGYYLFSASTTKIAVSGGYAYVGTEDGYLQILDVSDPTKPYLAGVFKVPGASPIVTSLAALENELYIGTNDSYVYHLDITNPVTPRIKSSAQIPLYGSVEDIALSQGRAYIVSLPDGLWVYDVTDPVEMIEIGSYSVPGPGRGVDVVGNLIYLACDDGGLLILKDNSR